MSRQQSLRISNSPPGLAFDPDVPVEPLPSHREANRKVLHVVESLDDQAVECWLLRVLEVASNDFPLIEWTFFCVEGRGRRDHVAHSLGAKVIYSKFPIRTKLRFIRGLRDVMKQGRYDVLHCHHDIMSALYLIASAGLPVRKRIVHVHNTSMTLPTPNKLKADVAREPMRQVCLRMADEIVGISSDALRSMTRTDANVPHRQIIHYAVDTERFRCVKPNRADFRYQLGLNEDAKILLFVGRMVDYKNPKHVIGMLSDMVKTDPTVTAIFAGTGDNEGDIRSLAQDLGLSDRVRLLGFRDDVPVLMVNSDLLIWPSREIPKEGLGLGIIEAQAAGLPILMSLSVPEEAIVIPELVKRLPLGAGKSGWGQVALEMLKASRLQHTECVGKVESSSFSLSAGVSNLMSLYDDLPV